jgi:predicted transcriptional regulator
MDPFDARILYERGMSIPEMAKYDGCTQKAAIKALLPQMRGPLFGIAQRIGADSRQFYRVADELGLRGEAA